MCSLRHACRAVGNRDLDPLLTHVKKLLSGVEMLTPKESALLFDINHELRNLHTQQAQARRCGDAQRVDELQAEIDELTTNCDKVLDASDVS